MVCDLKTRLELIRGVWFYSALAPRAITLKQVVVAAAELLPQLAQRIQWSHSISREEAESVRRKILKLLQQNGELM